ncbi:MAG TPA: large conductance mechanosensitive channel protein MscL [Oculatellaceae cyanobacterium]
MLNDFKAFLTKSNALALAIGVIIGGATGKVVSSIVDDLLMPGIATVLPPGDWREAQIVLSQSKDQNGKVTVNAVKYGHFIGSVVDFTIISFVVFVITNNILPKEKPPATKTCKECLETVPEKATRCKFCGIPLTEVA